MPRAAGTQLMVTKACPLRLAVADGWAYRRRDAGRYHRAQRVHIRGGARREAFRHVAVGAHGGGACPLPPRQHRRPISNNAQGSATGRVRMAVILQPSWFLRDHASPPHYSAHYSPEDGCGDAWSAAGWRCAVRAVRRARSLLRVARLRCSPRAATARGTGARDARSSGTPGEVRHVLHIRRRCILGVMACTRTTERE